MKTSKLNAYQRRVFEVYAGGNYRHLLDQTSYTTKQIGDPLFMFLVKELADDRSDKMTSEEAHSRLQTAIDDVVGVLTRMI